MKWFLIILGIAFVGYILFAARFKRWPFGAKVIGVVKPMGQIDKELARLQIPTPRWMHHGITSKGAVVHSVVEFPIVALDTIDAALDELFVWYKAAYPAWSKAFTHQEYAVLFIDPMATNMDGSPAIKVQGQQSAGTCIGFPFPMSYIVLPHQGGQGWAFKDYLFNSVFNEGEHFIESHNSREVFNRFVGLQDSHRHIGPPAQPIAFVGMKSSKIEGNIFLSHKQTEVPTHCGLQKV